MKIATVKIATVILHYGDPAMTARLHRQLELSDPDAASDLFVLDNCSPEPYPRAWLRTDRNLYWAGALAFALADRAAAGYTHVWFLNNDVSFVSSPPIIARVAGRLRRMDSVLGNGGGDVAGVGIYAPSVLSNPYHPQMVCAEGMQYRTVPYVDGIAPLISIACWKALGGLDHAGNPYGYGVDVWFSLCAHRAGWPVVVDHQVVLRHRYHSTARTITGFMQTAAEAEQAYLAERMGHDFRAQMDALKMCWKDSGTL